MILDTKECGIGDHDSTISSIFPSVTGIIGGFAAGLTSDALL